jgi:hypothetical protein
MAVEVNKGPSVYTVKYTNEHGAILFENLTATGTWDAEQKFKKQFPGMTVVNIYRKS